MKIIQNVLLVVGLLSCFAFTEISIENDSDILGTWTHSKSDSEGSFYKKIEDFEKDKPGIKFLKNGKIIKRQNMGWCGTPPISYGNYDGTWKIEDDSKLTITYEYWGGTMEEEWAISNLSTDKMKISRIKHREIEKK